MISALSIKGFKCFDEVVLQPRNIMVLAGKNSSGKSSIIQSILALKQGGINPFSGDYMKIGEVTELLNTYIGADRIDIEACYAMGDKDSIADIHIDGLGAGNNSKNILEHEIVYCSAERIGVQDTYDRSPAELDTVGVDCKYAFSYFCKHRNDIIREELVYDPDSLLTLDGQVNYWLTELVGCKMNAAYIDQTNLVRVEFGNIKKQNRNWSRPQNVGTGVTYIASIIVAAFSCHKGGTLIIENPEIHLHPSAQSKLLEFISFLSLCDIQVIIETHSDHIFNGLRKCVHNNLIDKSNQSIYFFREKENGCSEPVLVELDDNGKIKNMEDGLFDQIQKDLDVILDW